MLSKAIEAIEEEIASLKDRTAVEINDIYAYLSQPGAKTKLRPRIVPHKGYSTFSIIWQRLVFYNFATRRAILKAIRKGPKYQVPKSRLFSHCRNCASWEIEYIWEKEQGFARVRREMALLSHGGSALKQYCALERGAVPEQLESAVACKGLQEVVKALAEALKSLKERTRHEVAEVISCLTEDGRTGLRPGIKLSRGSGAFSVEWVRQLDSGLEREVPREGRYSIRRSRLLAHCRGWGEREQEFIWEKESEFARVRRQADLLGQAITALKQYSKEGGI
jgi:hypothetical protein